MKKFRVFCTDPDATDSSSDEEDEVVPKPVKRKRFFREINVGGDPPEKPRTPPSTEEDMSKKKYPGVRMRKWGKFASEIRHPVNKARIWLGTFDTPQEAYHVYYMKKLEFDALRASLNLRNNNSHNDPYVSVDNSACVGIDNAGKRLVDESISCEIVNVDKLSCFGGNNVNNDDSLGVEKVVEVPLGVERVKSGKWVGRINYPDSSGRIWMGMFNTMEEAVVAYEKKKAEFEERFKGKEGGNEGICEGGELSSGVSKNGEGRWKARVGHPMKKSLVSLGCYCSREEATMAVTKFEERFKGKESGNEGISEGGELSSGVRKNGDGKWEARIRHPKTMSLVSLGSYCSPGEASTTVNKEGEFEDRFKGKENVDDGLAKKKLPRGVRGIGYGRWQARIWHPKKKCRVTLGAYNCPKEAGRAVSRKRHQFEMMYGYNSRVQPEFVVQSMGEPFKESSKWDRGIRKTESGKWAARIQHPKKKGTILLGTYNTEEAAFKAFNKKKAEFEERFNSKDRLNVNREIVLGLAAPSLYVDNELMKEKVVTFDINGAKNSEIPKDGVFPDGITMTNSGRWGVRVTHPSTGTKQWVGSYLTIEEAVRALNRKKTDLDEKFNSKKRARLCPEPNIGQKMLDSAACYHSPTSVLDNESSNDGDVSDEPNNVLGDVPINFHNDLVNAFSDAMISGVARVKVADVPNFDEAVRLGIINEYGQLLGEFSKLDEPMWCAPNEDDVFLGFY